MKYLCLADLHLTQDKPPCRLDDEDWLSVIDDKFKFIAENAKNVDAVILAGDIFDSWRGVSFAFMNRCFTWFRQVKEATRGKRIFSIAGNHDCPNHSYLKDDINRSPYMTLVHAELLHDLHLSPVEGICTYLYTESGVMRCQDAEICVAHKGLYINEKPYPTAPDSGNVEVFAKSLPEKVKLVVAGDYHRPFIYQSGHVTIINAGSTLRRRADQIDYRPGLWIIDTKTWKSAHILFPLKNPIRRDYLDAAKEQHATIKEMLDGLGGAFETTMTYRENVIQLAEGMQDGPEIVKLFNKVTKG